MAAKIVMDDGGGPVTGSIEVPASTLVTLSNLNDTGVAAWAWTLRDKPAGSAATLSASNVASPTITPDIEGEYLIELITYRDAAMTVFDGSDTQVVGIRYAGPYAWLLPAAGQTNQRDSGKGWKVELNAILTQIRSALAAVVSGINQLTGDATAGPGSGSQAVTVVQARGLRETGGPTTLTMGAVADGEYLLRSGNTIVGGSGGSGGGSTVLYDMPIATASVGVAVRFRTNSDTGTPSGTAAKSLVAYESYPNKQALRLSATGLNGGLVWPVLHGITLPEEYILEVEIAGLDAASGGNKGLIFAMCDFYSETGVDSVRGLVHEHYRGFAQIDTRTIARLTGPYAAVNNVITTTGWPNTPNYEQRTHVARYHVRRKLTGGLGSPAQWSLRAVHEGNGNSDLPFHLSGVADSQTDFDGKTFDEIGIGVFGASGDMNIDIARLRILSVP